MNTKAIKAEIAYHLTWPVMWFGVKLERLGNRIQDWSYRHNGY